MREDIELYNESNAWALWARGLGGRTRAEAAADLAAVAAEHTFVGMKLAQDDELVVRLVVGDLEPDEEAGWTARITRRLDLPSGRLVLSGGFEPRGGAPDGDEFCRVREVPAGSYRVDIHTWVGEVEDDPEALLGFVVQLRPFDGDPIPTAAPWADWLEGRRQPPAPSSDLWPDRRSPAAPIPPRHAPPPTGPVSDEELGRMDAWELLAYRRQLDVLYRGWGGRWVRSDPDVVDAGLYRGGVRDLPAALAALDTWASGEGLTLLGELLGEESHGTVQRLYRSADGTLLVSASRMRPFHRVLDVDMIADLSDDTQLTVSSMPGWPIPQYGIRHVQVTPPEPPGRPTTAALLARQQAPPDAAAILARMRAELSEHARAGRPARPTVPSSLAGAAGMLDDVLKRRDGRPR